MKRKAAIISIKGLSLTQAESSLLKKEKPWGIILFKRNLKSYNQVKRLTSKIKSLTRNRNFPILIDEEGENVTRLNNIIKHNISAKFYGDLFKKDRIFCSKILNHYIHSLSKILRDLGININTVPVLDVSRKYTNKVIGNRSYSKNSKITRWY